LEFIVKKRKGRDEKKSEREKSEGKNSERRK